MYPVHVSHSLSCLDVSIKDYYLSLSPRLRVPVPPSCVHRDRRPDLTVSGTHSPRFVFCFLKSFYFVPVCLSRGMEVAARNPAIAHCKTTWEFSGIAASPLVAGALMPADRGRYPPNSHVVLQWAMAGLRAATSMPRDKQTGTMPQCPPARR